MLAGSSLVFKSKPSFVFHQSLDITQIIMKSVIAAISAHSIVDSRIRVQKKQMIDFFKPAGPSPDRLILERSYAGLAVD